MKDESRTTSPTEPKPRRAARPGRLFSSVDASMLGLGSQMFSEVVAGVLLGYGLDYLLGTHNRWIVVGSIAGIAVAMVSVFRVALRPRSQGGRDGAAGAGARASDSGETAKQPSRPPEGPAKGDENP